MTILIIIAIILLILISFFIVVALLRQNPKVRGIKRSKESSPWSPHRDVIHEGVDWFLAQSLEPVQITSHDGLKLHGLFLPADGAETTIILMHGYRSAELHDFSCAYKTYHELGYNILVPWQRSHADSEGHLIYFGVKERFDCVSWTEYINNRLGMDKDIIIEGMSMGATTVLMASALKLPENVRGIIADCGFTSPFEVMASTMKQLRLPARPYLDLMNIFSKLFLDFDLHTSTEDALKHCRIPVLLIHGEADGLVPCEMSVRNYNACVSPKELITVPNAEHGLSYLIDKPRCDAALNAFLNTNCKQKV